MKYKIEIVARGEGLVYQDDEVTINFSCGYNRNTHEFDIDIYDYSDSNFKMIKLLSEKEMQVLENILTYFKNNNERVNFVRSKPDVALKTTEELLNERLGRRDKKN